MKTWILTHSNLAKLAAAGVTLPGAFAVSGDPTQLPSLADPGDVPVLAYSSFAKFASDLAAGVIAPGYRWVFYDAEKWAGTPPGEQQDPWRWMREFAQLAHARGYRAVLAPARDLALVTGSVNPLRAGEAVDHWYVRTGLAGQAAYADVYLIQSERDEDSVAAYSSLVSQAKAQAVAANPYVTVCAEVVTGRGTAAQMIAAARSVTVDGFYVALPDGDVAAAGEFIQAVGP